MIEQINIKGKKCLFRYNGVFNSGYKDQFKEIFTDKVNS